MIVFRFISPGRRPSTGEGRVSNAHIILTTAAQGPLPVIATVGAQPYTGIVYTSFVLEIVHRHN